LLCVSCLTAPKLAAQVYAASTGTVDTASVGTYEFVNGSAYVKSGLTTGTVTLRFNVLPVGDLLVPVTQPCCEGRALMVRFLDNGPGANVTVVLKRYDVVTGVITTVLSFNSDNFAPSPTFQSLVPTIGESAMVNFDFATGPYNGGQNEGGGTGVYFLEATLTRSAAGGNPGLGTISIVRTLAP